MRIDVLDSDFTGKISERKIYLSALGFCDSIAADGEFLDDYTEEPEAAIQIKIGNCEPWLTMRIGDVIHYRGNGDSAGKVKLSVKLPGIADITACLVFMNDGELSINGR